MDYSRKHREYENQTGPVRRGVGCALFWYNTAVWPISLESCSCRMVLNQDGSIQLQTGETEIGQGCDTAFAQMAADAVGIPVSDVHVVTAQDTDVTPFGTGAYASRQTYVGGFAIAQKMCIRDRSPLIARELSFRFAGETDAPIPTLDAARLAAFLTAEFAALPPVQMQPMLLWKDGAPTDFTYRDIRQYGGYLRAEPCESFSALLDRFYTETDHAERMRQRSQTLRKAISNLHERTRRKLELQRQELAATHDREQLRRQGDIVTANPVSYTHLDVYKRQLLDLVHAGPDEGGALFAAMMEEDHAI